MVYIFKSEIYVFIIYLIKNATRGMCTNIKQLLYNILCIIISIIIDIKILWNYITTIATMDL